ncbi:glycerol-3-phosphate 1-O-acyltransferase PlsY [soil metagenome]
MVWILFASTALAAYLAGSFPTGYIAGRAKGVDLRKEGSGNIGATNALRVLGKKMGYLVFAGDALKGALGVTLGFLIAAQLDPSRHTQAGVLAAIFTVIGHNYPVWLNFQGGKGISTSAGIMIALFPIWVFLSGLVAWMALFFATRYVSVASIAASIALPASSAVLLMMGRCDPLLVVVATAMCLLALYRHKENIQRLLAGTEKKFEKKSSTQS